VTIRIVTDSACDLPQALADELGIVVVPLTVRFGEEEFRDRVDIEPERFWAKLAAGGALPETAAPSVGAFGAAFESLAAQGASGVVCITLSSRLSATHQAAQAAASSCEGCPVAVIDSLAITASEGNLCLGGAPPPVR
jgi:DegV family protein with EDD domain